MASAPYLSCHELTMSFGATTLFERLSFVVHPGERWGVVGANGSGKTTLFRILAGEVEAHAGLVALRNGIRTAIITQQFVPHSDCTVAEYLRGEIPPELNLEGRRAALEKQIEEQAARVEKDPDLAGDPLWIEGLTALQDQLTALQGAGAVNIVESAMRVAWLLHLSDRRLSELSGGEKKRLQIVGALLKNPQLILLDEPTNHLDIETVEWLEDFLLGVAEKGLGLVGVREDVANREPCAFLIVSHDRALLDTLVNKIVELDRGQWALYDGNFESYTAQRVARDEENRKSRDRMANLYRRELAWLRSGVKARTTKQTARIERAHDLEHRLGDKNTRLKATGAAQVEFDAVLADWERDDNDTLVPAVRQLGDQNLVRLEDLRVAHPASPGGERLICKDLMLTLRPRMRVALLGSNGCGKSTLLRMLADGKAPLGGKVGWHELAKVVYFDQHRAELDPKETVRSTVCPKGDFVAFGGRNLHVMAYLDQFLFSRFDANRSVTELSGGEQARLLLARLMLEPGSVLLLDEPTNDLDIPTLQMLEKSLRGFQGGVLFTSHDRYFIQRVATHVLAHVGERTDRDGVTTGVWQIFADLDQALEAMEREELRLEEQAQKRRAEAVAPRTQASEAAAKPKMSFKEKREFEESEKRIGLLEEKIAALETELSDHYAKGSRFDVTSKLVEEIRARKAELETVMARWEELFAKQG